MRPEKFNDGINLLQVLSKTRNFLEQMFQYKIEKSFKAEMQPLNSIFNCILINIQEAR